MKLAGHLHETHTAKKALTDKDRAGRRATWYHVGAVFYPRQCAAAVKRTIAQAALVGWLVHGVFGWLVGARNGWLVHGGDGLNNQA
jgi:hypothetical protein